MHTFLKEAKRKQKWTTFARIHRLACQRNTLLKHRVSAEVCLLGHQWISRGFTLRKVQYHQYTLSRKIHWTLITQGMREDLQIDFFSRNVFWTFLWDPTEKRQYPKYPSLPPKKKNRFLFGLGRPIRNMLLIFQDDRSTTLSNQKDEPILELYRVQRRHAKLKPTTNYQLQKSIRLRGQRNITGQNTPSPNVYRTFLGKKSICPTSSLNNIKAG